MITQKDTTIYRGVIEADHPLTTYADLNCKVVQPMFSFFRRPITNIQPLSDFTLLEVYDYITGPEAKENTLKLRCFSDAKQAKKFKAFNFDYCTFSGRFSVRSDSKLLQHSGLMCLDFDHVPNWDLLCKQLINDEHFTTQLLFRSPSGDGIKWIVNLNPTLEQAGLTHAQYFCSISNYIKARYNIEADPSGKDISRACFLPYAPDAVFNFKILES